jgi:serine protease inhibitor
MFGVKKYLIGIIISIAFLNNGISCAQPVYDRVTGDLNNRLAFDLYKDLRMKDTSGDILIAPLSYLSALGMVYLASDEQGREALNGRFHLGNEFLEHLKAFYMHLNAYHFRKKAQVDHDFDRSYSFGISNSMWFANTVNIPQGFGDTLDRHFGYFGVGLKTLDYKNEKMDSIETINKWHADHSKRPDEQIIKSSDVSADTSAIVISLTNFSGYHIPASIPKVTQEAVFYGGRREKNVMMMERVNSGAVLFEEDYKAYSASLAFHFDLLIIMPEDVNGLAGLEGKIDQVFLDKIQQDMLEAGPDRKKRNVKVRLPRFTIEGRQEYGTGPLRFFGKDSTCKVISQTRLTIRGDVVTTFDTPEYFTLLAYPPSAFPEGIDRSELNFNRPFIFFVVTRRWESNFIVFMGRYMGGK